MSKRDYIAIAQCLYSADFGPVVTTEIPFITGTDRRLKLAQKLADNFELTNPLFDRARFIHCAMTGEESISRS